VASRSGIMEAAGIYNAMIAPIAPFPIKGVIWYQGESNSYPMQWPCMRDYSEP